MDFEIYYHISQQLDCIVRGGMCMPFHAEPRVRRLSIDIDLLTTDSLAKIEKVMTDLNNTITDVKINPFNPRNPAPLDNLVSYSVEYKSNFEPVGHVKVDFYQYKNITLPKKTILPTSQIFDCDIDFPIHILDYGALIGDKLTTLALDQIGFNVGSYDEIPKQVYDVATLLKYSKHDHIEEAFKVFEEFTNYKTEVYRATPSYTTLGTITRIEESISTFLTFENAFSLSNACNTRYGDFKGRYLGEYRGEYSKTEHISDVLLVWIFARLLLNVLNKTTSPHDAAVRMLNIIRKLDQISDLDASDKTDERKLILDDIKIPFNKNILKTVAVQHVYLLKEVYLLGP